VLPPTLDACRCISGSRRSRDVAGPLTLFRSFDQRNPGDERVFRVTHGFEKAQLTERVVEAGPGGYILRGLEERTEWYWLSGFRFLGMVQDSEIVQQYLPPLPVFNFPMKAGSTWRQGEGRWHRLAPPERCSPERLGLGESEGTDRSASRCLPGAFELFGSGTPGGAIPFSTGTRLRSGISCGSRMARDRARLAVSSSWSV